MGRRHMKSLAIALYEGSCIVAFWASILFIGGFVL